MPSILALNSGSTSVKYKLFRSDNGGLDLIGEGLFENVSVEDYEDVFKKLLREIGDLSDLSAVGHRIVHGGEIFNAPVILDAKKISELEKFNRLAPLHNPFNLLGAGIVMDFLPAVPQIAVFDTAFFFNLPESAKLYGLPFEILEKYKIRRYGFHGLSHEYAMKEAAKILGKSPEKINLVTCHLGGGWSAAVIEKGRPIDVSMGFTPMEGLPMMTRSGDLDPGMIFYLIEQLEKDGAINAVAEVKDMLNRKSGVKGLSDIGDFKELLCETSLGREKARRAFDFVVYRLVKMIGSYLAVLEGKLDAVVFTGAIGAGNPMTRNKVAERLKFLEKTKFIPVKPNEELAIAEKIKGMLLTVNN